jgi:hypothetical protein
MLVRVFAAVVLLSGAAAPAVEGAPGLVVLDVKPTHGVPATLAQVLGDVLLINLRQSGAFGKIVSGADLDGMLQLEQQKTVLGCEEDNCLAELGGLLGVPYLLRGQVARLGGDFLITLHLVGVEESSVLARAMTQVKTEAELTGAIAAVIPRLLADLAARPGAKAPAVRVAIETPKSRWLRRAGYGVGAVGVGLTAVGWMTSVDAQAMVSPGPSKVTEAELIGAQSGIDLANRYSAAGVLFGVAGVGLFVWAAL